MDYIFDTSGVIVLLEICCLEKQLSAFSVRNRLYIPERVRDEFLTQCKINPSITTKIFSVVNPKLNEKLLPYFNFDSNSGEFWAISYACHDENCCCVIDEEFGRNICAFFRVKSTGSVGIINEMKKQGFLAKQDLLEIRDRIRNSRFYLSKELLAKLDEICLHGK